MAKPMDLVFVRHGLSEANIIQRAEKTGTPHPLTDAVYARPDVEQRLALEGVEQARAAGHWLRNNFIDPADFDERYVSPFNRTVDTAKYITEMNCLWLPDFRIVERDWGIYGATPKNERPDLFPHTEKMKEQASFYTRLDNGESIGDVALRVRDFIDTLDRDTGDMRVLAVTHGELMWAARFVIERMLPQEWQDFDKDKSLRIGNCCIMWYTRTNPENPDHVERSLSAGWLRMVDPVEPDKSPYDGEWQRLPGKRRFSGQALGELADKSPRLL